jgi:hypothetical protein
MYASCNLSCAFQRFSLTYVIREKLAVATGRWLSRGCLFCCQPTISLKFTATSHHITSPVTQDISADITGRTIEMNHDIINASISPTDNHPFISSFTKMGPDATEATTSQTENYQLSTNIIRTSHNNTDATAAPMEKEQPTCHSPNKMCALHKNSPMDPKASMPSVYNNPTQSPQHLETTATAEDEEMDAQDSCLLFKLPPELRNQIYAYAIDRTDGQYGWVEDHDGPRISLLNAKQCAPSNELLTTCRRIFGEGRGIFVQAQRDFWSKTTFTFGISGHDSHAGACLDDLSDEQVNSITSITIKVYIDFLKIHLGSAAGQRPTSWGTQVKVDDNHESHESLMYTFEHLKDQLFWTPPRHGCCQYTLTPSRMRWSVRRVMSYYWNSEEFVPDIVGAADACPVCGGMEWDSRAGQRTKKSELLMLVAYLCLSYDIRLR